MVRQVDPALLPRPESYRLHGNRGSASSAPTQRGFSTAGARLPSFSHVRAGTWRRQLAFPSLRIEDWPDFPHRGVMLDVSRDKVPTHGDLARARRPAGALGSSTSCSSTWSTPSPTAATSAVWQGRSAAHRRGGSRARRLLRGASHRAGAQPEQLRPLAALARAPEPYRRSPSVPRASSTPGTRAASRTASAPPIRRASSFLPASTTQLLPNFSSRQFNVGLDETFDLGHGRSRAACESKGTVRVYLDFLQQVHALVAARAAHACSSGATSSSSSPS